MRERKDGRLQQHERRAAAPRQRAAPQPAAGRVVDQDVQDGAKGGGLFGAVVEVTAVDSSRLNDRRVLLMQLRRCTLQRAALRGYRTASHPHLIEAPSQPAVQRVQGKADRG